MEGDSSFTKASASHHSGASTYSDKRLDVDDLKTKIQTDPGASIKLEDAVISGTVRAVLDEKMTQQLGVYEEERPMNLVKKMKLEKEGPSNSEYSAVVDTSKENLPDDAPMDLSSGTKRKETKLSRKTAIERLRDELCNEETTLLLLKKLQRSQMLHRPQDGAKAADHTVFKLPVPSTPASKTASVPPPLVRGSPQQPLNQPVNQTVQTRPEPPRVTSYGQPSNVQQHMSAMRGPPPMLSAPRPSVARPTVQPEASPAPRPAVSVPTPEQTLAQSKDAAKLALRRQLEATLLQIPPPKPAALAVNFIPSIGSNVEFVSLVGLEEVVTCIASQEATTSSENGAAPVVTEARKPFQCAHCQTDYTPVWRRSQSSVDEILCEKCAITAQKRMLKQEHTARLKAAFMHALQQEREIEASGGLAASAPMTPVRPAAALVTDPKIYTGLSQQHSRSVPSFHALTDPRILPVSSPYGLISAPQRGQFGAYSHRSDHNLVKRVN